MPVLSSTSTNSTNCDTTNSNSQSSHYNSEAPLFGTHSDIPTYTARPTMQQTRRGNLMAKWDLQADQLFCPQCTHKRSISGVALRDRSGWAYVTCPACELKTHSHIWPSTCGLRKQQIRAHAWASEHLHCMIAKKHFPSWKLCLRCDFLLCHTCFHHMILVQI